MMAEKSFELDLTPQEIPKLLEILSLVPLSLSHDLLGPISTARLGMELVSEAIDTIAANEPPAHIIAPLHKARKWCDRVGEELTRFTAIYDLHFNYFREAMRHTMLTARPTAIIEAIRAAQHQPNLQIEPGTNERLQLLFPTGVLGTIFWELATNVEKHSPGPSLASWKVENNRFYAEIHDSGPALITTTNGFVDLETFMRFASVTKEPPHGLHILNKIILRSGGMLLFGRSSKLHGNCVRFSLPVLRYSESQ